jgi:hypothetical protein
MAPVGLFQSVSGGFVSIDEDFGITFEVQSQNYPCDPDEQILNAHSIHAKSVRDINVTYKSVKKDRYVFSGFDSIGRSAFTRKFGDANERAEDVFAICGIFHRAGDGEGLS